MLVIEMLELIIMIISLLLAFAVERRGEGHR